jgi:hypothetical protein
MFAENPQQGLWLFRASRSDEKLGPNALKVHWHDQEQHSELAVLTFPFCPPHHQNA